MKSPLIDSRHENRHASNSSFQRGTLRERFVSSGSGARPDDPWAQASDSSASTMGEQPVPAKHSTRQSKSAIDRLSTQGTVNVPKRKPSIDDDDASEFGFSIRRKPVQSEPSRPQLRVIDLNIKQQNYAHQGYSDLPFQVPKSAEKRCSDAAPRIFCDIDLDRDDNSSISTSTEIDQKHEQDIDDATLNQTKPLYIANPCSKDADVESCDGTTLEVNSLRAALGSIGLNTSQVNIVSGCANSSDSKLGSEKHVSMDHRDRSMPIPKSPTKAKAWFKATIPSPVRKSKYAKALSENMNLPPPKAPRVKIAIDTLEQRAAEQRMSGAQHVIHQRQGACDIDRSGLQEGFAPISEWRNEVRNVCNFQFQLVLRHRPCELAVRASTRFDTRNNDILARRLFSVWKFCLNCGRSNERVTFREQLLVV